MEYCTYCRIKLEGDEENCSNCGIPLKASEEEKSRFITNIHRTNEKFQEAYSAVVRAKWILFSIGLITLLFNSYLFFNGLMNQGDFIVLGGLGCLLTITGFLTNDYPIPSVSMGIIFVLGMFFYSIYSGQLGMMKGIIWKILIFSSLIYALKSASEYENMIKKK